MINPISNALQPGPFIKLPKDLLRCILQKENLKVTRAVCRVLRVLSDEMMISQVNALKLPLIRLGLSPMGYRHILYKFGPEVKHLDLEGFPSNFNNAGLFWNLCPNIETANFGAIDLSDQDMRDIAPFQTPNLVSLDLRCSSSNERTRDSAYMVAQSNNVTRLKQLDLSLNRVDNLGLQYLVTSTNLTQLETLTLRRIAISNERSHHLPSIRQIFTSINLPKLRNLEISECKLHDDGLAVFLCLTQLTQLEALNVASCSLRGWAVRALATTPNFPRLRALSLSDNKIGLQAIHALADSNLELESLSLSMCELGDEDIIALSNLKKRSSLRCLELRTNQIEEAGIGALVRSNIVTQLEKLDLNLNRVNSAAAALLFSAFNGVEKPKLKELNLGNNKIGNGGLATLAKVSNLELRVLNLRGNDITERGIIELVGSSICLHLRELVLGGNRLSDSAIELLAMAMFPQLELLDLANTGLTAFGIENLANFPKLTKLHLQQNLFRAREFKALANLNDLPLEEIDLSSTIMVAVQIFPEDGIALAILELAKFRFLTKLNLHGNPLAHNFKNQLKTALGLRVLL